MLEPEKIIYLDNNATTQIDPAVVEEMLPFLTRYYGNPSSGYRFGRQVRDAIERARERVAALLGCQTSEVIFTSGGTESNNTAINSALQLDPTKRHLITTAVEHSATLRHCEHLAEHGCEVTFLGVDHDGNLDPQQLERAIRPDTAVISIMWANNETGVLFPVDEIAEIARRHRAHFHTDAVQLAGKLPIELPAGVTSCAISAHKLHGPKGVGALYVSQRSAFRPMLLGGGQENNRRAGTENAAAIVGFGKAVALAQEALATEATRLGSMRERLEAELARAVPDMDVNGHDAPRLPNTSSVSFNGVDSAAALAIFDRHLLCCSAGSACLSGSKIGSHVLQAMNLPKERIDSSVRFSFSRFNTDDDVAKALEIVTRAIAKAREVSRVFSSI